MASTAPRKHTLPELDEEGSYADHTDPRTSDTITLDPTKYDAEQINLMEERLILLDNDDNAIGEGSKKDCELACKSFSSSRGETAVADSNAYAGHLIPPPGSSQTRSPLHRAFSVFLFHPETGKLLLQRRADEKITFPGMWTNTCCSHPLTSNGEMDEQDQIGSSSLRPFSSRDQSPLLIPKLSVLCRRPKSRGTEIDPRVGHPAHLPARRLCLPDPDPLLRPFGRDLGRTRE